MTTGEQNDFSDQRPPGLWQRCTGFFESHPRFWRFTLYGAAATGVATFGLDVASVVIDQHMTFYDAELIPQSIGVAAMGAAVLRYVNHNYLSGDTSE